MSAIVSEQIWKRILMKIDDPRVLTRLQLVSKEWRDVINELLPLADWKRLCFKEISQFLFFSIIAIISPELKIKDFKGIEDKKFWREVFYHYQTWKNFKKNDSLSSLTVNKIPLTKKKNVTCFDVWFQWIACGTSLGSIYILKGPNYKKVHSKLKDDEIPISQVKFWYNGNNILHVVSLTQAKKVSIWNVNNGTSIDIEESEVAKICVGTVQNLYVGSHRTVSKYVLNHTDTVDIESAIELNLSSSEFIDAINSRESRVFVVTRKEFDIKVFVIEDKSILENRYNLFYQTTSVSPPLPRITSNIHTYFTYNRTLICSQKNVINTLKLRSRAWIQHTLSTEPDVSVNCLIMHGNYIIAGLTNGKICFRYLEDLANLSDPSFLLQHPTQELKLSIKPIIDIKVVHVQEEVNLMAVTASKVFMIKI